MAVNHQNFYFGTQCAYVPADKITAHNMQSNKEMVSNVMNGAFKLYYDGYQASAKITDVLYQRKYSEEAKKKIWDLQSAMQKDLRNTANRNKFMADLLTCFRHLESTNGYWRDTSFQGWRGVCNIPEGVADFLEGVAEKQNEICKSAADWEANKRQLQRLKDEKKWGELPDQLQKTSKVIEYVGPKLWAGLGVAGENASAYTARMTQVFGWAGHVHTALDLGLKIKYSSNPRQTAFVEAMAFVVQGLPVFGSLYAEVIRGVPAMVSYFQRIARERYRAVGL